MKKLFTLLLASVLLLVGCSHESFHPLEVEILKIGKADCQIITIDGQTLMIDTGEDEDSEEIINYLKEYGIDTINYLIITHYDKDHVGGADKILQAVDVEQVFEPGYPKDSTQYNEYVTALNELNIVPTILQHAYSLQMAEATVTIYPPQKTSYDGDNDYSLVTTIVHGENSFLFTGDAEDARLQEIMDTIPLGQTFLKVPHHGNSHQLSEAFLKAVSPKYAVITCSAKNPPSDEVLEILNSLQTKTYLTSEGSVHCLSNGHTLSVLQVN